MPIKYKWLANSLQELIQKNIKKGIDKLPTEGELCKQYNLSRQTVRQALAILENNGLIEKRQGSGSYITGLSSNSAENMIGILLSESQEYIYPGIIHDIQNTLYQHGYSSKLYVTQNRIDREREVLQQILENPPRGLIVEGCKSALPNPNLDLYLKLKKTGTKLLFLHNHYPALAESIYLEDDNLQGSLLLTRHLIKQGHTAIGGIFHAEDLQGLERYQGFIETMRDFSLSVPDHRVSWYRCRDLEQIKKEHDRSFLRTFIKNSLSSCTAVVCYNDEIAYLLSKALKAEGYKLPSDMAIVSFDNSYLKNTGMLSITNVSHKPHEMGRTVALHMVDLCKGLLIAPQKVPWELVVHNSTPGRSD